MAIKVFHFMSNNKHNHGEAFSFATEQARQVWDGENANWSYVQVALVDTNDKEDAFEWTNHIDHDWTRNLHVTPEDSQAKYRSTSTGDFLEDQHGLLWLCGSIGWKQFVSKKPCPIFVCNVQPACPQHDVCHRAQRCLGAQK